jgi:3-oxoacyl-[acyl-carrier-protein] synthase II
MTHARRVAVTGLGVVSPAGCRVGPFWESLTSGISAVSEIRRFDASSYPTRIAAEIPDFRLEDHADLPPEWKDLGRIGEYAGAAASLALEDSGLLRNGADRGRIGVLVAAGMGTYGHREVFEPCSAARSNAGDSFDWNAFASRLASVAQKRSAERRTPGSIPAALAHRHGLRGPVMSVMTACAAGTQALGDAARWIREGLADAVVAGGSDSELYPMGLASFCLLGALSTRNDEASTASRPFDASRDGFVIGEGAGVLVLEEMSQAIRRGARIYAEVAGFGSACDSYRVTDPHPEGKGAVLAMGRALEQAGVGSSAVGYINAHGTSTVANDSIETAAIKRLFGPGARSVPISSTKSIIGHLTVAAGAVEAIATALTLFHRRIHPTINYERPDPECDLDYVPKFSRAASIEYALSNSFAFGGQCASLLLKGCPQ